jgi:hypothetical protein
MCEILVKAIDTTHDDPAKDRRGCYKRGYPVVIKEDGHPGWGKEEGPPKFFIMKFPGIAADKMRKYIEQHEEPRQETLQWNKLEWDERQQERRYFPFLSAPIVLRELSEQKTMSINIVRWFERDADEDYFPFYTKPKIISIENDNYQIRGTIVMVELQGDVMTTITRRLWKINLDALPKRSLDKLNDKGQLTIDADGKTPLADQTWAEIRGLFNNQKTGLSETEEL